MLQFLYLLLISSCGIITPIISGFGGMELKIQMNPQVELYLPSII